MKERPILFCADMVRALLAGTKTQTRRALNPQPVHRSIQSSDDGLWYDADCIRPGVPILMKYGTEKDCLWVRETFIIRGNGKLVIYRADLDDPFEAAGIAGMYGGWKPSIFMPRWASRITLEIVSVRVERLQEITEADAKSEGVKAHPPSVIDDKIYRRPYEILWGNVNVKTHPWARNPWVFVIEFRRL